MLVNRRTDGSKGTTEVTVMHNLLRNPTCPGSKFVIISGMSPLRLAERLFAFCHSCVSVSSGCPTSMSQDRLLRTRACYPCSTLLPNRRRSTINHRCKGVCISRRRWVTCISPHPKCTWFNPPVNSTTISHQQSGYSSKSYPYF
jgi:hypothetical protein